MKENESAACQRPFLTEVDAVLGVEAAVFDEVDAAADHIARREGRAIGDSRVGRTEGIPIIAVVAVGVLVPACTATKMDYKY